MLKTPNRSQRLKSFKVKHVIQACLFLAICLWLLIQVKRFYDKSNAYVEIIETGSEMELSQHEPIKLGRKDLDPQAKASSFKNGVVVEKQELGGEIEEVKSEETEDGGRGGGDDEIDGHDQEKAEEEEEEEVEDLIDEEDREREDDIDEFETEEKGNQIDESNSWEGQSQNEGERNLWMTKEEHYKGDDTSSAMMQNMQTTNNAFEIRGLRQLRDEEAEITEDAKLEENKEKNIINNENKARPELGSKFRISGDHDTLKEDLARKTANQFVKNIKTIENKPL